MKFARLFELGGDRQVLVTVDYSDRDDSYSLSFRTDDGFASYKFVLGFDVNMSYDDVLVRLNALTPEDASSWWRSVSVVAGHEME